MDNIVKLNVDSVPQCEPRGERTVLGRIRKNAYEEIVVSVGRFKERRVVSAWVYANGIPLKGKGIAFDIKHTKAVIEAMQKLGVSC